jgi:hypothetical protein
VPIALGEWEPILPIGGRNPSLPANAGANVETAIITAVLSETKYVRSGDVSLAHQVEGEGHRYAVDHRTAEG